MSKLQFTAPKISLGHASLLRFAASHGVEADVLRQLLWLTNAHPDLLSHARIFQNLSAIFASPVFFRDCVTTWASDWTDLIPAWIQCTRLLSHNKTAISRQSGLGQFDLKAPNTAHHPMSGLGLVRHAISGALWNVTELLSQYPPPAWDGSASAAFFRLQAHFLAAVVESRHRLSSLEFYEQYDGELERPIAPTVNSAISPSIRELSYANHAPLLELFPDAQPPVVSTYLTWLRWFLHGKSSAGNALALSTIRKRFFVTTTQLLLILGESNPADLCTPTLVDIYAELTGDPLPDIPISHLKEGLRDFHAFLVQAFGHSALERAHEVLGNDASLKPVDGNIVSFDDYRAIDLKLKKKSAQRNVSLEEIKICRIVLMLAFRAGLRRMEIFGLRLSDIQTEIGLDLTVTPHILRGLKTANSERVIPLRAFLNAEERFLLKHFVSERRQAEQDNSEPNGFLFSQFAAPHCSTWINKIYKLIRQAIRSVTGDDTLYMHHLRHSFGTWTYLRLRAPDFPELVQRFDHLPETRNALATGTKLRLLLLHRHPDISRKYGYLVARLLGHSSPMVSLGHYIHCCDLIAGAIAHREFQSVDPQVIIAASGLPKSTAYENLAKGSQHLIRRIRRQHQGLPTSPQAARRRGAPRKDESDAINQHWIPFQTQLDVLAILKKPGASRQSVCDALQVTPELVDRILDGMSVYGKRFSVIDKQGGVATIPPAPRIHEDIEFFFELESRLRRLFACDPKLFAKGIELHLSHVVLQKNDVLFQEKKEFQMLKAYLKFMKALNLEAKQLRWVFRQVDSTHIPAWCNVDGLPIIPASAKRLAPPKPEKAVEFANTIGVLLLAPWRDEAYGTYLITAMLLAATMLNRLQERGPMA